MLVALIAGLVTAQAQDVTRGDMPALDSQLLRLGWDSDEFITTRDSSLLDEGFSFEAWASYSNEPLVYLVGPDRDLLVNHLAEGDLFFAYRTGNYRVGLEVPIYLYNWDGTVPDEYGLGDLSIDNHLVFMNREDNPVGVSMGVNVGLPTSTMAAALGAGGVSVAGDLAFDGDIGPLTWALNGGVEWIPVVELENLEWGPRYVGHGGLAYTINRTNGIAVEAYGRRQLNSEAGPGGAPAELLVSGWHQFGSGGKVLRVGGGAGLLDGIGSSTMRVLVSLTSGDVFESAPVAVVEPPQEVVEEPPPPPPEVEPEVVLDPVSFGRVFFGYDSASLTSQSRQVVADNVAIMRENGDLRIQIQGHADERGTTDYNLALGQSRAQRVFDSMVNQGIAPSRLSIISYGEEQPLERGATEEKWTQNRRAEFMILEGGADHISGSID